MIAPLFNPCVDGGPLANAPQVSIITPDEGTQVSGVMEIRGEARDDSAITSVEVSLTPQGKMPSVWMVVPQQNIVPIGGNISHVAWNFSLDSRGVKNGAYTVWARSFDDSTPSPIHSSYAEKNVTVENSPPPVTLDPLPSTVSGKVTVTGRVDRPHAKRVIKVELIIQSATTKKDIPAEYNNETGGWSAVWDTTEVPNGGYTLRAMVWYDTLATTTVSNEVTTTVDNPLSIWVIIAIILLIIFLVIVIILVIIWILDRRKIKALNLNPKDVKKESLIQRFVAFIMRRGKVYFLMKFEGATTLGSMHTIDMLAIKKEKKEYAAEILGKVTYRISEKDGTISVFSVNDWGMKKRHPIRILRRTRKDARKNGVKTLMIDVYDSDPFARDKVDWLERARFQKEGETTMTGTRVRKFTLKVRRK